MTFMRISRSGTLNATYLGGKYNRVKAALRKMFPTFHSLILVLRVYVCINMEITYMILTSFLTRYRGWY